jgi:hypothetical protein
MPLPLLYRNRDGLYNEEKWNLYYKYEDYEQDVNELTEIMDELISYINDKNELEDDIFMVCTIEESEKFESYQKYRELYTNKQLKRSRTNLIRMLYQENVKDNLYKKISLFEKYFLCEDAVELFQKHTTELSQYGFVFSKKEFLKAFETQKQLFSWYKCRSLQEYKTKFDEIGVDGLLLKWFDVVDMEKAYWFDASMYPCYQDVLPENWFEEYTSNEEIISDEDLISLGYYEESLSLDEKEEKKQALLELAKTNDFARSVLFGDDEGKEDKSKNKSPKKYPEIPF